MSNENDSDSDQELFPIEFRASELAFVYEDPLLVTGVLRAVVEGNLDQVKSLISEGKSPNINDNHGNTPLHVAVIRNLPNIVDYLLSLEEILVNSRNFYGETPLFTAVKRGHILLVKKLIQVNSNVNLSNFEDITPLHISVNNPEIARLLIENGANINALDYSGETPLHEAVNRNCIETVCMLLYYNADANMECDNNITPFMKSIIQENVEIQEILLDYVVDFNTVTKEGMTVLNLALTHTTCPYVGEIIERGADVNYQHQTLNAFCMCLTVPNVDNFRLVWQHFKYQEISDDLLLPTSLLDLLTVYLCEDTSCFYEYLRIIINSGNLEPLFQVFSLSNFYDFLISRRHLINDMWFNITFDLIFLYLSNGYILVESILIDVYDLFGYNELFYICLHMDNIINNCYPLNLLNLDYILYRPELTMDKFKCLLFNFQAFKHSIKFFLPHLRCEYLKHSSYEDDFLNSQVKTIVQFPSLLELARNKTRDALVEKFKLKKTKQYYSFIHNMSLPKVCKDYLTFRKGVYSIKL